LDYNYGNILRRFQSREEKHRVHLRVERRSESDGNGFRKKGNQRLPRDTGS